MGGKIAAFPHAIGGQYASLCQRLSWRQVWLCIGSCHQHGRHCRVSWSDLTLPSDPLVAFLLCPFYVLFAHLFRRSLSRRHHLWIFDGCSWRMGNGLPAASSPCGHAYRPMSLGHRRRFLCHGIGNRHLCLLLGGELKSSHNATVCLAGSTGDFCCFWPSSS